MIFALQGSLQIKKIYDPSWCLGERQWMVKKSKKSLKAMCKFLPAWKAWGCESCLTSLPLLTGPYWALLGLTGPYDLLGCFRSQKFKIWSFPTDLPQAPYVGQLLGWQLRAQELHYRLDPVCVLHLVDVALQHHTQHLEDGGYIWTHCHCLQLQTLLLDIHSMTASWDIACLLREFSDSSISLDTSFSPFILKARLK